MQPTEAAAPRLRILRLSWWLQVDPNDIRLETRDDGSLKVLGAGTYGKVRAARCAGSLLPPASGLSRRRSPPLACRGAACPGAARLQGSTSSVLLARGEKGRRKGRHALRPSSLAVLPCSWPSLLRRAVP